MKKRNLMRDMKAVKQGKKLVDARLEKQTNAISSWAPWFAFILQLIPALVVWLCFMRSTEHQTLGWYILAGVYGLRFLFALIHYLYTLYISEFADPFFQIGFVYGADYVDEYLETPEQKRQRRLRFYRQNAVLGVTCVLCLFAQQPWVGFAVLGALFVIGVFSDETGNLRDDMSDKYADELEALYEQEKENDDAEDPGDGGISPEAED